MLSQNVIDMKMIQQNIDCEGKIRTFTPDLTQFHALTKLLSVTTLVRHNAWFKISDEEARQYLTSCLRMYAVLNNHYLRAQAGISDLSYLTLIEEARNYPVPRYFRDVFREIVRPMTDGADIWIPDLAGSDDILISRGYEINPLVKGRIPFFAEAFKVPLVPIEIEVLRTEPICAWYPNKGALISRGPIPEYRWKSVSILRHVQFEEYSLDFDTPSGAEVQHSSVLKSILEHVTFLKNVSSVDALGRISVGGLSVYQKAPYIFNGPDLLTDVDRRFPTDDVHSDTPPSTPRQGGKKGRNRKMASSVPSEESRMDG